MNTAAGRSEGGAPSRRPRPWDLLALGDPCVDLVMAVDHLPEPGGKTLARPLGQFAGGTTANAACALARLGGRAAVFGRVGGDAHGAVLRDSLTQDGVDTTHLLTVPGQPSGQVIGLIPPGGDRALVVLPMAPGEARDEELRQALAQARVAYLMPYALPELARTRALAQAAGTCVAIDLEAAVAPDAQAMRARLALADLVFFNDAGFRAATGCEPTPQALADLLALGPQAVVVTLGARGAVAADRLGMAAHPAFDQPVRDTTGAGDTFNAAFLLAWLEGQPLAAGLRLACAAAGLSVGAIGARNGMPDRAAVQRLLDDGTTREA